MSKKKIQLSIPDPCDQKFSNMILAQGGRFCGNCEKVVVDFTDMTDQEIAHIFMKNKGKVCGQFRKNQLDRNINLPSPPVNSYRGKAASILLSSILTAGVANAQNNTTLPQTIENQQITDKSNSELVKKKHESSALKKSLTVNLIIIDEQGEGLIGASVSIKNQEKIRTMSDIDGAVKWTLPDEIKEDKIVLVLSFTGLQSKEISISRKNHNSNQVRTIILDQGAVLGGYVIVTGYAKPRSETLYHVVRNWWYKLRYNREARIDKREERREHRKEKRADKKLAKQIKKENSSQKKLDNKIIQFPTQHFSISLKNIFPNPFSDELNLEIFSQVKNDIQISIFDLSGKKIYQVTQGVIKGNQKIYLNLRNTNLENGEYILHLKEENGQVQSRKLIRISAGDFRLKN